MVDVPLLTNTNVPVLALLVTPVPNVQLPEMFVLLNNVSVIALVRANAFTAPITTKLIVTVPAAPASSNTAVSCGNGYWLMSGVPPDVGHHPVDVQL